MTEEQKLFCTCGKAAMGKTRLRTSMQEEDSPIEYDKLNSAARLLQAQQHQMKSS